MASTSNNIPQSQAQAVGGDDSDWEYEYSNTETEAHYITVDLSIPDLLNRREEYIVHNTRGGYRAWQNPDSNAPEIQPTNRALFEDEDKAGGGQRDESEVVQEGENADDGEEDDDQLPHKHRWRKDVNQSHVTRARDRSTDAESREIQILDLHHDKPLISYHGIVFTGVWAENIGTELLFTPHDPKNPLQAVRNLPQDVDILGASSARIACTPAELRPREVTMEEDRLKRARRKLGFAVSITQDARGSRRPQATFLENLMAVKRMKGEKDVVTVHTIETKFNEVIDDPREDLDRSRKRKKSMTDKNRKDQIKQASTRGGTPKGRPRGRVRGRGRARGVRGARGDDVVVGRGSQGSKLSTATPAHWGDLRRSGGGQDEDVIVIDDDVSDPEPDEE